MLLPLLVVGCSSAQTKLLIDQVQTAAADLAAQSVDAVSDNATSLMSRSVDRAFARREPANRNDRSEMVYLAEPHHVASLVEAELRRPGVAAPIPLEWKRHRRKLEFVLQTFAGSELTIEMAPGQRFGGAATTVLEAEFEVEGDDSPEAFRALSIALSGITARIRAYGIESIGEEPAELGEPTVPDAGSLPQVSGGPDARAVLNSLGYDCGQGDAASERTVQCLKRFQRDLGLPATGVVDPRTEAALRRHELD